MSCSASTTWEKTTFYNLQVKYEADFIEGGDTFLGTLKPGETANVDSMLTAAAPSAGGTVKAVISFEDESGNPVSFEREFALDVYEEVYMEPEMPEDMMPAAAFGAECGADRRNRGGGSRCGSRSHCPDRP